MRRLILFFCTFLLLTSCMNNPKVNTNSAKNTYLLVHGAWHGKWCWQKLSPLLEKEGHTVLTIDLPGSGADTTSMAEVNLASYTNAICEVLSEHKDVILLGHSLGGISITQAGEECTEKIKSLVYLAAVLPKTGESLMSRSQSVPPPESSSEFIPHYEISADGLYSTIKPEMVKDKLCHDCSDEIVLLIQQKLSPQSNIPLGDPVEKFQDITLRPQRIMLYQLKINVRCIRQYSVKRSLVWKLAIRHFYQYQRSCRQYY